MLRWMRKQPRMQSSEIYSFTIKKYEYWNKCTVKHLFEHRCYHNGVNGEMSLDLHTFEALTLIIKHNILICSFS